jgi:Fur family ferric uptake transcriptional regulator
LSVISVDFANKLHREGYRLTPQRQLILEAVRKAGGHLTPDQVYARVHTQHPAVSRATIYRTLDFLCEMRLAVAMQWDGQTYYEIAGEEPHHHLICRTCGGIEPLASSLVDSFVEAVARKQRFTIDMDHIALFGLCERCRVGKSASSRHSSR